MTSCVSDHWPGPHAASDSLTANGIATQLFVSRVLLSPARTGRVAAAVPSKSTGPSSDTEGVGDCVCVGVTEPLGVCERVIDCDAVVVCERVDEVLRVPTPEGDPLGDLVVEAVCVRVGNAVAVPLDDSLGVRDAEGVEVSVRDPERVTEGVPEADALCV